jgi:predicted ATPase
MSKTRLIAVTIERFKAFQQATRIELKPLSIIIGRNNAGKSTLIQSLLILKQTLRNPRADVMLSLEGPLEAFNLREITTDWPAAGTEVLGPVFSVEWQSEVDLRSAFSPVPDLAHLAKHSGVAWLRELPERRLLRTSIRLHTTEVKGTTRVSRIELTSADPDSNAELVINLTTSPWSCKWNGKPAPEIEIELDRFIPYLRMDMKNVAPRLIERAYYNAYLAVFKQPLESLRELITDIQYLGSSRLPPPSLYRTAQADPSEIGVSGEFAAQLLQRRGSDIVHFLPLPTLNQNGVQVSETVRAIPLAEAVNEVMQSLSIDAPVSVHEIEHVGFQLKFGGVSVTQVGRGLNHILPVIEVGLYADPLRFSRVETGELALCDYLTQCPSTAHILYEEPEAHLHPKVASRLAHLFVSLAQSGRQIIVETHSDHLVRRLRGLAARAGKDSSLEKWLLENVSIFNVEQDTNNHSSVSCNALTSEGGVGERWPADFMDEASNEESAIYYAQLEKSPVPNVLSQIELEGGAEPVSDTAP